MEENGKMLEDLYHYIRYFTLQHGHAPTEREIIDGLKIEKSRRTIERSIQTLIDEGRLTRVPGKKRNLRLVNEDSPHRTLPITGKIAAGNPIEPVESDKILDLTELLSGPNRFVLEVVGDSMQGDKICNGDYVICEHRDTADNGEIVVALIKNTEVTLKRIQHNSDNTVTLLSSNACLPPMVYRANDVKIQGVYLGLIRLMTHFQEAPNEIKKSFAKKPEELAT